MNSPKRILFVSSNPHWTARLDLGDEMREIMHSLRGQDIELMLLPAAQREDLEVAIKTSHIDVLHFSGHATPKEGLILRDEDGMEDAVSPAELRELLEGKNIKLAFLNACTTKATADAIEGNVDAVIGTTEALDDEAAKKMTKVFYSELGTGQSIDQAFEEATETVEKEGFQNIYIRKGKALGQPLLSKATSDGSAVTVKGQPHYDKYFFISYLDEQIRDLKGRVALNQFIFWFLFVVGVAFVLGFWNQRADIVRWDFLINFFGQNRIDQYMGTIDQYKQQPFLDSLIAIGAGIPALLAFFQKRLTVSANQELRSLTQLKEVAKASEELTPEMQDRLQKVLDQCIRGADRDYQPLIDWYGISQRLRPITETAGRSIRWPFRKLSDALAKKVDSQAT